jgi:hypothetical protein
MPSTAVYRTGQAAKQLGISTHAMRRLMETGIVEAELTNSGQWKIPVSEVERLQNDGLPPIPQALQEAPEPRNVSRKTRRSTEASLAADDESPAVRAEYDQVRITEGRLQRRRLELEAAEIEDRFAEREAQRVRSENARKSAESLKADEAWRRQWVDFALKLVPTDCPAELLEQVLEAAKKTVGLLDSSVAPETIGHLVSGVTQQALSPYYQAQDVVEAVRRALNTLPVAAQGWSQKPSEWEIRAKRLAMDAIRASGIGTLAEMTVVAERAVKGVCDQFEHQRQVEGELAAYHPALCDLPEDLVRQAKLELRSALSSLPVGCGQSEIRRRAAGVLTVYQAAGEAVKLALRQLYTEYDLTPAETFELPQRVKAELPPLIVTRFGEGRLDSANLESFVLRWLDRL